MQAGDIKNFRLSNSCSAGNGMLLQAMAAQFGLSVTEYAEHHAFDAGSRPSSVTAARCSWTRIESTSRKRATPGRAAGRPGAGACPRTSGSTSCRFRAWPNWARFSSCRAEPSTTRPPLKAQVDYIKERVPGAGRSRAPAHGRGRRHRRGHGGPSRRSAPRQSSTFVGLDHAIDIEYTSTNDDEHGVRLLPEQLLAHIHRYQDTPTGNTARYISGFSCEKGTVEDLDALKEPQQGSSRDRMKEYPNLVDFEAKLCFKHVLQAGAHARPRRDRRRRGGQAHAAGRAFAQARQAAVPALVAEEASEKRKKMRIGIPRVLNLWSTGPVWRTYFETWA